MSHAELQHRIIESKNEEIAKLRELLVECKERLGNINTAIEVRAHRLDRDFVNEQWEKNTQLQKRIEEAWVWYEVPNK